MADAVDAVRQGVQEKAPNELVGVEGHDLRLSMMPVVLPAEGNATVIAHIEEPRVRDGNPMGVAAEIGQHLLRPAEGRLDIDDPFDLAELAQPAGEGRGLCKAGEIAEECEFAGVEGGLQFFQEPAAEKARENTDREVETRFAGNLSRAVD